MRRLKITKKTKKHLEVLFLCIQYLINENLLKADQPILNCHFF